MLKYKMSTAINVYLIIGLLAGLLLFVMPLKMAVLFMFAAAVGISFLLFSFFNTEISYIMFLAGAAVIPSEYWNNLFILLSALFYAFIYFIKWLNNKNAGLDTRYIAPSLILLILFFGSSLFTGFGGMDSVRVFAIFLGCAVHSVLIVNFISTKEYLRIFILMMAVSIALTSLFGLYQYFAGIEIRSEFTDLAQNQGLSRLFSSMGNPNNDAEFWVMTLPFVISMICLTKSDVKRLILAGTAGLCLLALMYTYSRSGYLALIGAAGVFVALVNLRLVPVGLAAFAFAIPFLPQSLLARVSTLGRDTSSVYRLHIWEGVFRILEDFWIQGIGMGPSAFTIIYRDYASTSAMNAMHSHNIFLSVAVEAGIGGIISFMVYFFRCFKTGILTVINTGDIEIKFYMAAAVASLTGFTIFGLVEYVWFYPRVMLTFWTVAGLVAAIAKINENICAVTEK